MKYPIGIQTFENIIEDGFVYVDKTDMVYSLATEGKVYFLSRPRRFGKSLLLSTLKAYFEGKRDLFKGLKIESLEKEWYAGKVKYAQFLHDRSELKFGKAPFSITYQEELKKEDLSLELPVIKPNIEIPVIELILNE